jgi:hypothetical protein
VLKKSTCAVQFADKGVSTVILTKSFGQAFSKACAVEGAEPSSSSAEGEISYTAFLFASFFFAPTVAKEKATKAFVLFDKLLFFKQGLSVARTARVEKINTRGCLSI